MASVDPSLVRSLWSSANIDFLVGDAVGFSGGTLLMWDSSIFARDEVLMGTHYVGVIGKWNGVTEKIMAIWILFGDFNVGLKTLLLEVVALQDLIAPVKALGRVVSDHYPILMSVDEVNLGPKCFKIFNHCMDIEGFDNVIESSWNNDRLKREEYLMDLNFLEQKEIDSLKQKRKMKWAVEGDENTKFFDSRVKKNTINGFEISLPVAVCSGVANALVQYYGALITIQFLVNCQPLTDLRSLYQSRLLWTSQFLMSVRHGELMTICCVVAKPTLKQSFSTPLQLPDTQTIP
ncbi:hypothetical protein Tco_1204448 [Tanacetum coccineum]